MPDRSDEGRPRHLRVLGIHPWNRFWSMGEFKGAPSFFLAPQALVRAGHEVHISMPAGGQMPVWSSPDASSERPGTGGLAGSSNSDTEGRGRSPAVGRSGRGTRERRGRGATGSRGPCAGDEYYYGMKLHRYRFSIDFMPKDGPRLYIHITRPFRYLYCLMLATAAGLLAARACRPDVVVGYGAFAAPVAFLVARSFGLPNVTRLFGQSLSIGLDAGLRKKLKCLLNFPEIVAFLTHCSCLIVCDDGSQGDKVARRFGVPVEKTRFWRNGVDKRLFSPPSARAEAKTALGLAPDAPLLLSVSRLDREKHHERLIRAAPAILKSFPSARFIIIGEGDERANLQAETERLGVTAAVSMPGALSHERIAGYYKACDIFVSLSDRTNIANPTLEAMSCGACVVALDVGGTSDFIRNEETGIIVRRDEIEALPDLLVALLKDRARRESIGEGAAGQASDSIPSTEERARMEAEAVEATVHPK